MRKQMNWMNHELLFNATVHNLQYIAVASLSQDLANPTLENRVWKALMNRRLNLNSYLITLLELLEVPAYLDLALFTDLLSQLASAFSP